VKFQLSSTEENLLRLYKILKLVVILTETSMSVRNSCSGSSSKSHILYGYILGLFSGISLDIRLDLPV
jgi:hypothetical protein